MADIRTRIEAIERAVMASTGGGEAVAEWRDFQEDFEQNEPDAAELIRQAGEALGKNTLRSICKANPQDPELCRMVNQLRRRVALFCKRHWIQPAREVRVIRFHPISGEESRFVYSTGSDDVTEFILFMACDVAKESQP